MLATLLAALPTSIWTCLVAAHGRFWHSHSTPRSPAPTTWPPVTVIVPARNEAQHLHPALQSLLGQHYPGRLHILLVDDNSTDSTSAIAQSLAQHDPRLRVLSGALLAPGWSGKLWAVQQALLEPEATSATYLLLTDADILHAPTHLRTLVAHAQHLELDLASEMVRLRTQTLPERALIPAFVFFFQLLYPFARVNAPTHPTAAAAGGTMLVHARAMRRIGNLTRLRSAVIDDVALAREIKRGRHPISLTHATEAWSLRQYPRFADVRDMVARTAFVQLRHSPVLLAGTVAGMAVVYLAPPALTLFGRRTSSRALGATAWLLMAVSFQPTLRRHRRSPLWGLALPAIAAFYTASTLLSALRHVRGQGAQWKGRTYPAPTARPAALP